MNNINNNRTFEFIGHSTMGRERSGLVIAEDMERSAWRGARDAATIEGALHRGKRKEERKIIWKGGEMGTYVISICELSGKGIGRDTKGLSTEAGAYVNTNQLIDLPTNVKLYKWERVTFKEISFGEQIIKLKSPIKIEAVPSDEGFSLYYKPLDILVSAPTLDECEEDFQEEFNVLYKAYAEEADEKLTEGARELKSKLLSLVKADQ